MTAGQRIIHKYGNALRANAWINAGLGSPIQTGGGGIKYHLGRRRQLAERLISRQGAAKHQSSGYKFI